MINLILFSACFISAIVWLILLLMPIRWRMTEQWEAIHSSDTNLSQWPSLSVIVPARNESTLLPLTLPSWLNQDYPGSEIILIDDESSDRTSECAKSITEHYRRTIRILKGTPLPFAGIFYMAMTVSSALKHLSGRREWRSERKTSHLNRV